MPGERGAAALAGSRRVSRIPLAVSTDLALVFMTVALGFLNAPPVRVLRRWPRRFERHCLR